MKMPTAVAITFVEGWTFRQMRKVLDENPALRHETRGLSDRDILQRLEGNEDDKEIAFPPGAPFFHQPRELRDQLLGFFLGAVQNVVPGFPGLPSDPPPLEFQVPDPAVLHGRLRGAGLDDVRLEPSVERLVFATGQELWDWVMNSNPLAGMVVGNSLAATVSAARRSGWPAG